MKDMLCVFLGGGAGSVLRYLVGVVVGSPARGAFPQNTFLANVAGCFLIGLLGAWLLRHSMGEAWRLLLIVGFCGGFTTMSSFSNESLSLLRCGSYTLFVLYVLGSVVLGLVGVYAGSRV